jgi:hypothetical protein
MGAVRKRWQAAENFPESRNHRKQSRSSLERLDKSECMKGKRSGRLGGILMMQQGKAVLAVAATMVGGAMQGALLVLGCNERCAGRAEKRMRGDGDGDGELGESALWGN